MILVVRAHLAERLFVGVRIVLDRDLRRHAADGMGAAAVAGLDAGLLRKSEELQPRLTAPPVLSFC